MCAEKMQRLIQAIILGMVMGMAAMGIAGEQGMLQLAFLVQLAMMIMLIIAGLTGWCPGLMILKKIFPPCKEKENGEG
jgi:Mg/Co/Ni transporter MgtE